MKMRNVVHELWLFGLKQAYACMFGGFLLAVMILTSFWYPIEGLHRYDFLFLAAVAFQIFLLITKLETPREAIVIVVFHVVATIMELFKTSDGIGLGHILMNLFLALPMFRYLPVLCTAL